MPFASWHPGTWWLLVCEEQVALREWFQEYLQWLETSQAGVYEYTANNHRGVFYDIQMVSIASYLNDTIRMLYYLDRFVSRLRSHITKSPLDGRARLGHEAMTQPCEENQVLALQAWSILNQLGHSLGCNLYGEFPTADLDGLSALCRVLAKE